MEPSTLAIVLGLVGLVCLIQCIRSVKGKRVGTSPHCRSCGYDLTGRPAESMQCSECGAGLGRRSAIVLGEKRRSGKQIAIWGFLSAGLLASVISQSVAALVHYPWIHLAPANWLIADIDGPPSQMRTDAGAELRRRFALPAGLDAATASSLIETLLKVHADQSKVWDQLSADLFSDAASAGQLSDAQLQRFLEQSVVLHLETHPSIRRGKGMILEAGVEFVRMPFPLGGHYDKGDVLINGKTVLYSFDPNGLHTTKWPVAGGFAAWNVQGSMTLTGVETNRRVLETVADGPIRLGFRTTFSLFIASPFVSHRVQFFKDVATSVRLASADTITDAFTIDASRQDPAKYGILEVIAVKEHGKIIIELRINSPPLSLAMDVLVRSAGHAEQPWQNTGPLRVPAGSADSWYHKECDGKSLDDSPVEILLRPSQDAADSSTEYRPPFCGNELHPPFVPVLRADSPSLFASDPSLRQKVRDAVHISSIAGGPTQYQFDLDFGAVPVTLFMDCFVRAGSREILVQRGLRWRSTDAQRVSMPFSRMSYGLRFALPQPAEQMKKIDVILRPIPELGPRPSGDSKPWGEEIVFKDLPLPKPATP